MTQVKNTSLAGEQLVTQYGTYVFDANGIVEVPDELAQKLISIKGFTIVGHTEDTQPGGEDTVPSDTTPGGDDTQPGGDDTVPGDTTPGDTTPGGEDTQSGGEDTQPSGDVTLDSGAVWHKIEGGYVVSNDIITFTITGAGVDSDVIPPNNVTLQNDVLLFDANIDVDNVHVKGVTEGSTILIGENTYTWVNLDGNLDNGYELEIFEPPHDLPGGGSYSTVEGGYALSGDGDAAFTIPGADLDTEHISIQDGKLVIAEGADIDNLVVIGVEENDTIQIGDDTYKWVPADDEPGMKLEFVPHKETLSGGGDYYTIPGGFVLGDGKSVFTLTGDTFDADHISVQDGNIVIEAGADVANLHILGVNEGDTIQIGDDTYKWENTDNISSNGYELILVSKEGWSTIEGGYVFDNGDAAYTLIGSEFTSGNIIPNKVTIQGTEVSLSPSIDTSEVHIIGVTPNSTIAIGDDTYKWVDSDNNPDNGLELEYVPEVHTIEGGGSYTTLTGGGYELFDDSNSYSIISDSFDADHISIHDGKLVIAEGVDTADVHIIGIEENSTIQIGDDTYKWVNSDNDLSNGYELEYVQKPVDLPDGGTYITVEGGYELSDGTGTFTVIGDNLDADHISIQDGELVLSPGIDINSVHVIGVEENSTIAIGDDTYRWKDTDNNPDTGYELVLIPNTGWAITPEGCVFSNDDTSYTISGSAITFDEDTNAPTNVSVVGGKLEFDPDIDTLNIHVIGVEKDSVVQIGEDYYKWTNADGEVDNGLELSKIDVPEGFEYDFDGKKFFIEGGIDSEITLEQLNTGIDFDKDGKLIIGKDIVSSIDGVHIQGLESGSKVNIAGEDYTLIDTDNDLENGYELVGGSDDALDWRWSNRNRPADPQIWRHYNDNTTDIKVTGASSRPTYNQRAHTITIVGDEISSIINSTASTLKLAGDIKGVLSPNSRFSVKGGIVDGAEGSYVLIGDELFVPNGTINKISGDVEFTLTNKQLSILSGTLNVETATVSGSAITSVTYANKNFTVSGGKLIRNAVSRRRTIKVS